MQAVILVAQCRVQSKNCYIVTVYTWTACKYILTSDILIQFIIYTYHSCFIVFLALSCNVIIKETKLFIPHTTSCGGYNVFDLSVSQSISPVFLVSATPLKPLNRVSWNFVAIKDIMCRCAYPQEILIKFFFWE